MTRGVPHLDWLKSPYVGLTDYEPEEPPRHAIACETHGWYRGVPQCPQCWDEERDRRSAAAALRALELQPRDPRGPQPIRSVRNGNALRQLAKTHCPRKHPYDDENTYRDKSGYRSCRTCKRDREARRYLKRARGLE